MEKLQKLSRGQVAKFIYREVGSAVCARESNWGSLGNNPAER